MTSTSLGACYIPYWPVTLQLPDSRGRALAPWALVGLPAVWRKPRHRATSGGYGSPRDHFGAKEPE